MRIMRLDLPVNKRVEPNVVSLLDHRLRRWPNTETALCDRILFAVLFWLQGNADLAMCQTTSCMASQETTVVRHIMCQLITPQTPYTNPMLA